FIAEERDGGKEYVIRYPDQFKLNGCVYRSYGGRMRIEEKSDDPRLKQEPYDEKDKIDRATLIYGFEVSPFFAVSDDRLGNNKSDLYFNKLHYNIYCYKKNSKDWNNLSEQGYLKFLRCSSSSIENGVEKYLGMERYTISFWKENPDIELNFKISHNEYCDTDMNICQKFKLPLFDEKNIQPQYFQQFYDKEPY
ncbi:hypothetical protein, partial [Actinobacillus vicugnae]|uniref:hypothetical protein n=1 Tax=Actinobacillus vicugnae TaxID=2573093 RepID=UPI00142E96F1